MTAIDGTVFDLTSTAAIAVTSSLNVIRRAAATMTPPAPMRA
ncbi:hypothetical protein [Actinoplanes subglobosus]|uniref:Uncharacterized protein n=1 Tax=Actinoplanes subglobosus TaxID=1547892 RepID=A0ABV8IPC5_9ACTN